MVLVEWIWPDGSVVATQCRATAVDALLAKRSELRNAAVFLDGHDYTPYYRHIDDDLTELKKTLVEAAKRQLALINAGPDYQLLRQLLRMGSDFMMNLYNEPNQKQGEP
jgi:uncharacterized membrane protein YfbV (UPF0208 family)